MFLIRRGRIAEGALNLSSAALDSVAHNAQTTADATGRVFEACRVPSIAAPNPHERSEATNFVRRYSGLPLSAELSAADSAFGPVRTTRISV